MSRVFPLLILTFVVACGSPIDREKFEALNRAGTALQVSIREAGGLDPFAPDLLTKFQAEVASLEGRIGTREEGDALAKYREAGEAYHFLLRVRFLEHEAGDGPILFAGNDLEAALHYGLPVGDVDTSVALGRFAYVEKGSALQTVFALALRLLTEADAILNKVASSTRETSRGIDRVATD